jgi:hypothetical protein
MRMKLVRHVSGLIFFFVFSLHQVLGPFHKLWRSLISMERAKDFGNLNDAQTFQMDLLSAQNDG